MNTPANTKPTMNTGLDIERIYKQTANIAKEPLWSLKEVDFVTHFLPVFAGEEESAEKLGDWTRMAGGPGRYVAVVNQAGEQLFLVPPLQLPAAINSNAPTLKGTHIYAILDNFKRIAMAKSAGLAKNYLENSLDNYAAQVHTNPDLETYQNEWQAIFTRYNIQIKAPAGADVEAKKDDDEQIIGFDPV